MNATRTSVKPPLQKRSLASMNRLLDATEKLLADQSFDAITIQDVVKAAKSSIGVFYSRFEDKEALLVALVERHQSAMIETMEDYKSDRWEDVSVTQIVRGRVSGLIKRYRKNRGLYRTLVLRGHAQPDWRYDDAETREKLGVGTFVALLASHRGEIGHRNLKRAAALVYVMMLGTLRETILFSDGTASALKISDRALENELVKMILTYLEVNET